MMTKPKKKAGTGKKAAASRDARNARPGEPVSESLEAALAAAGCDVASARAALHKLRGPFPSGIPEPVLERWITEHVPLSAIRGALLAMACAWEKGA